MKILKILGTIIMGFLLLYIGPHYIANWNIISPSAKKLVIMAYPIGGYALYRLWRLK